MAAIQFHPHTADEKFTVKATTLEEAFSTAVLACKEIMIGKVTPEASSQERFIIKASRLRSLLYDFLNEVIAHLDASHVLLTEVENLRIHKDGEDYVLEATLFGVHADSVDFRTVIKNMTYSDMAINQTADGVELTVVVDI